MARIHRLLGAACVAFVLAGCGARTPTLSPLAGDAVVLAFGDSLTAGNGAALAESYPARLGVRIGRRVVNAGVSGELSAAGAARLPGVLDTVKPQLMVLIHGGNDLLRKQDEAAAARNLRAMIALARDRGVAVVMLGVPKPSLAPTVAGFYAEIAKEAAIPYDGETLASVLRDNALKSDLVHPNAAGYAQIAERVHELLKRAKAL